MFEQLVTWLNVVLYKVGWCQNLHPSVGKGTFTSELLNAIVPQFL